MLLLNLKGTPTIYYGDEIGMRDVPIPFEEVQDPQGLNMPDKNLSRDPARTPMQWDNSDQAGFTDGQPWLRLNRNFARENVQAQKDNPYSMLSLYRRLIQLRQQEPSLMVGDYLPAYSDQQVFSFVRHAKGDKRFLIVLNLSHRPCYVKPKNISPQGTIVLATDPDLEGNRIVDRINLGGDEGIIIQLEDAHE